MHKLFAHILFVFWTSLPLQAAVDLVNGTILEANQLPQIQPLWSGEYPICTATLVGKNVIITAAHCIDKSLSFGPRSAKVSISKFITHPQYIEDETNVPHGLEVKYDVALGILEKEIDTLTPLSITSFIPETGSEIFIAGAGNPDNGIRKYGKVKVMKTSKHGVTYRSDKTSTYASNGDSGGPSLQVDPNNKVSIFGVISTSVQNNDYTQWFGELGRPFTMASYTIIPSNRKDYFLDNSSKDFGLKICGINLKCPQVEFSK